MRSCFITKRLFILLQFFCFIIQFHLGVVMCAYLDKDYYMILRIHCGATTEEIRRAYIKMAKIYHPDKRTIKNPKMFIEIREAYETLKDPNKRRQYDAQHCNGSQYMKKDQAKQEKAFKYYKYIVQNKFFKIFIFVVGSLISIISCKFLYDKWKLYEERKKQERIQQFLSISAPTRRNNVCIQNHGLKYIDHRTLLPEKHIICRICGKLYGRRHGSWYCRPCEFYICNNCYRREQPSNMRFPSCKYGHAFMLSVFGSKVADSSTNPQFVTNKNSMYICLVCKNSYPLYEGMYFCCYCNIKLCPNCQFENWASRITEAERKARILEYFSAAPPRLTYNSCLLGHLLTFIRSPNFNRVVTCNECGKMYSTIHGTWACPSCSFFICEFCYQRQDAPTNAKYPACVKGHPLIFSVYPWNSLTDFHNTSGMFTCKICGKAKNVSFGRYFCCYCLVNLCASCQFSEN